MASRDAAPAQRLTILAGAPESGAGVAVAVMAVSVAGFGADGRDRYQQIGSAPLNDGRTSKT